MNNEQTIKAATPILTSYFRAQHAARVDAAANDPARIERRKSITPALTVPRYRIEWTGNIKVYQPIRPTVHQAATEAAVMSA